MTTTATDPAADKAVTDQLLSEISKQTAEQIAKSKGELLGELRTIFAEARAHTPAPAESRRPIHIPGLEVDSPEVREYSFAAVIKGLAHGTLAKEAPLAWEIHQAAVKAGLFDIDRMPAHMRRNLATTPDSSMGVFVPSTIAQQFIPLAQASSVLLANGAMRIGPLKGDFYVPKITGGSTVSWVNQDTTTEPSSVPRTGVTTGQLHMWGHQAVSSIEISNKTLNQASVAIEPLIRGQMGRDMGLEIDRVGINGTGGAGEPVGFMQRSGVGSTAISSALTVATAYDKLLTIRGIPRANNITSNKFAWILHPDHLTAIEQMKDPTDGSQPKARRLIDAGSPDKLLGFPYYLTTQCPAATLAFVALDHLIYGEWGGLFVSIDSQAANRRLTTSILIAQECDWALSQDKAVSLGTSIS